MISDALKVRKQEKQSMAAFLFLEKPGWTVCGVNYSIYILQHFPHCGQMTEQPVESRLSRLVSDYKATSPCMSSELCMQSLCSAPWTAPHRADTGHTETTLKWVTGKFRSFFIIIQLLLSQRMFVMMVSSSDQSWSCFIYQWSMKCDDA